MNPLARLYANKKISGKDLYIAETLPLIHLDLFLEKKAHNTIIDTLFDLCYRIQLIGSMTNNKGVYQKGVNAHIALLECTNTASVKGWYYLDPSTDQKKAITAALKELSAIAPKLTNKVYIASMLEAAEYVKKMNKAMEQQT